MRYINHWIELYNGLFLKKITHQTPQSININYFIQYRVQQTLKPNHFIVSWNILDWDESLSKQMNKVKMYWCGQLILYIHLQRLIHECQVKYIYFRLSNLSLCQFLDKLMYEIEKACKYICWHFLPLNYRIYMKDTLLKRWQFEC